MTSSKGPSKDCFTDNFLRAAVTDDHWKRISPRPEGNNFVIGKQSEDVLSQTNDWEIKRRPSSLMRFLCSETFLDQVHVLAISGKVPNSIL